MDSQDRFLRILRYVWGYDSFRGVQEPIIHSISQGHDTLGLMPTGGGKSITFQVPALTMDGTCLVVTPLIALMKDQVRELRARGIKATALHSDMSDDQCMAAMDNCIMGGYKLLYVSPERLSSPLFLGKMAHMHLSFITIDEAHCISQWGYDFRPSYLLISDFRRLYPQVPVLALTATATPEVVEDIQRRLLFPKPNVFSMSFCRPNLAYRVLYVKDRYKALRETLEAQSGSTIIYMRNREGCKDLAEQLQADGITATFFHAGLKPWERDERQSKWLANQVRVMVATNAFGMGINKPDVRLVAHLTLPDSLEEYFQEAGRAGRDGQAATSIIFCDRQVLTNLKQRVDIAFPSVEYVQQVYEYLCFFFSIAMGDGMRVTRQFDNETFCRVYHLEWRRVRSAIALLDRAGYIAVSDDDRAMSRLCVTASRNELLNALSPKEQTYFLSIFRHYGGIFVDFVFFDETFISRESGVEADYIYQSLLSLSMRGLVRYVPRKSLPQITFLQRRMEKEDVVLTDEVYRLRKEAYQRRIDAMMHYCTSQEECRSQMLLRYFGETESQPCGICDYCLEVQSANPSPSQYESIRRDILAQLAEGPLSPEQFRTAPHDPDTFWLVLDAMIKKEEIQLKDFQFERSV